MTPNLIIEVHKHSSDHKMNVTGQKGGNRSAGSISGDDGTGCLQKNFHIEPRRTLASIAQIEANHFIKSDSTPSLDLPESSDSRLRLEQATAVPWGVSFDF